MSNRELAVNPCRSLCSWRASRAEEELFVCGGCGSQWVPSEAWTPIDADGTIPEEIGAARHEERTP